MLLRKIYGLTIMFEIRCRPLVVVVRKVVPEVIKQTVGGTTPAMYLPSFLLAPPDAANQLE